MIRNGIDCIDSYESLFKNKRLGLITSISGVNNQLKSSIEILHKAYGLTALFGPEHGVRGNIGAGGLVEDYIDTYTGVPVYSLYRKDSKKLTQEMLDKIDAIVYDIQDLGVRYYTFISTMIYTLEECARHGKEVIILDRYNPLGDQVEGNCLKKGFESFVGAYPICMRYGLTVGELAKMVNTEMGWNCNLTVIPCQGIHRAQMHPESGNVWVMPSLGMPRFETALLYSGTCLFEGTNISEGRGTAAPFEIIGAPFIDGIHLVEKMREKKLPGVMYSPAYFNPWFSKFQGKECEGIHIHITDYSTYQSARTGLELLFTIQEMYGEEMKFLEPYQEGGKHFIELLFGSNKLISGKVSKEELLEEYEQDSKVFAERKQQYHIYQ